jgi:hypothetical protein
MRLLIVVDQLEEILALPPAERDRLVDILDALARSNAAFVVATARSDAYGALQALPALMRLKEDGAQFDLAPPGSAAVREIVTEPARAADLTFERDPATGESLDERLVHDAGPAAMLPLLQFTLAALYDAREDNRLTFAAYQRLGGFDGAIGNVAEEVFAATSTAAQASLPSVLRALVRFGADGEPVRVVAERGRVAAEPGSQELVEALLWRRLLVASRHERTGEPMLCLAHDALVQHWPRARAYIAENRDLLLARQRIEVEAAEWAAHGLSKDLLLPDGRRLREAMRIAREFGDTLSPDAVRLIQSSWRRRRRRLLTRAILSAAPLAFVALLILAGYNLVTIRDLAIDATRTLIDAELILARSQPDAAAPSIARALTIARRLAAAMPNEPRAQENVARLMELCAAVKCEGR